MSLLGHEPPGAFAVLGEQRYGALLLAAVSGGLIAYGVYQVINVGYEDYVLVMDGGVKVRTEP